MKSMSKIKNVIIIQGIYVVYSFILIIGKMASKHRLFSPMFILFFALELLVFGIYAVLWQQVMKKVELTLAYSGKGAVILWTLLWSLLIFNESVKFTNVFGALIIFIGIYVVMSDE